MTQWTRGRGALGALKPLLGSWLSEDAGAGAASGMRCVRTFQAFGPGFVRLDATWRLGARGDYLEVAFFGKDPQGGLAFWSFTSDGKRSEGVLCEASDIHPMALAFEADMPAGRARMLYWPADSGSGFNFAVESKVKKGWNRFLHHRYHPMPESPV
jgi:hypothetical protein